MLLFAAHVFNLKSNGQPKENFMQDQTYSFDWAIAPISRDDFLDNSFEKKHLVVRRNDPDYYRDLLSSADIDHVVSTMGLYSPEINVTKAGGNITAADFTYESGYIDPVRVNQLFADGATVILSGLQERLPKLARFCRALESVMSSRVQTNIYMTPADSQGFRAHYDQHDVLVLQVEGTKEWRIYDTPVELPLNTQGFDPHDVPIGEETDRFILEPGDMVYVPRGLTHDAVATDQTSLHITTGFLVRTWADLLAEAVSVVAHSDPAFRKALPAGHANIDFDASGYQSQFEGLMKRLAEQAPLEKLMSGFKQDFLTNRVPRVEGQMAQIYKLNDLDGNSTIRPRPHLIYDLGRFEGDDEKEASIGLSCYGGDISFPPHVEEPLRYALTTPEFKVADLAGPLDLEGKLVLVRRLVKEGILEIA